MYGNDTIKLRSVYDKIFEQSLDLAYFSKTNTRFDKNYLIHLLKIEIMFQKSVANFYITTEI